MSASLSEPRPYSVKEATSLILKKQAHKAGQFISLLRFAFFAFFNTVYFNDALAKLSLLSLETIPVLACGALTIFLLIMAFARSLKPGQHDFLTELLYYLEIFTDLSIIFLITRFGLSVYFTNTLANAPLLSIFIFTGFYFLIGLCYLFLNNLRFNSYRATFASILLGLSYLSFWLIIPPFRSLLTDPGFFSANYFWLLLWTGLFLTGCLFSIFWPSLWQRLFIKGLTIAGLKPFFSPSQAESLAKDRSFLDRKASTEHAALLYTEITNLAAVLDGLTSTDQQALLNFWYKTCSQTVFANRGALFPLGQAGYLAVFGLEAKNSPASPLAAGTALKLYRELKTANELRRLRQQVQLEAGFGLYSGEVTLARLDNGQACFWQPFGEAITIAYSLEKLCKGLHAPILLSDSVVAELGPEFSPLRVGKASLRTGYRQLEIFKIDPFHDLTSLKVWSF